MGLYLCVFNDDEEIDGVELGAYDDFGRFRDEVYEQLEHGECGSRFPVLMRHSDCDGSWSVDEARSLLKELAEIEDGMRLLPPISLPRGWQSSVARSIGLKPQNLAECFFDIDGEPLLARLKGLCRTAIERRLPILFQ